MHSVGNVGDFYQPQIFVIPAEAGIQSIVISKSWKGLGPGLRRDDGLIEVVMKIANWRAFQRQKAAIPSRGGLVDMYVNPDRNAPLHCWGASELDKKASLSKADQFGLSLLLGLGAGLLLYLLVVRIPFGTPRKSLKSRWAEESL